MSSYLKQILALIGIMIGMMILGSMVAGAIWMSAGIDLLNLGNIHIEDHHRPAFRWGLLLNHFLMFTGAGVIFVAIFHKNKWAEFLNITRDPAVKDLLKWGFILLICYPFMTGLIQLSESLPLPEWLKSGQSQSFKLMSEALKMNSIGDLAVTLILVGILAGVGEEIIFRGILQKIFEAKFANYHTAVWLAAIIFGAFHMQAERFLPLTLIGVILGYSYYFTGNLIVPILLHFLNNSLQVLGVYMLDLDIEEQLTNTETVPLAAIILSGLLTFGLLSYYIRQHRPDYESRP